MGARIQNALASVTERFQGLDQFRAVPPIGASLTTGRTIQFVETDHW
jgi:hypothetical protein